MKITASTVISRYVIATLVIMIASVDALADMPDELISKAEKAFKESDIVNAMSYYRKAAEAGYIPAQNRLAYLLDKSEENEEAVQWYQKAAAQGDAEGEYGLARMYVEGEGIEQNKEEALRLFRSSANKNYTPAIHVMATAYEKGELGLRVDYELAREWLEKGAQLHDHWSTKRLATAYSKGQLGLRIDQQKAAQLEQQLSETRQ